MGVSLAFGDDTLSPTPTWVRLDDPANPTLVASYQIDRGRPTETQRTDGSTATVAINDRYGVLDPTNPSSPYFGEIEPLLQAAIARWNPVTLEWDTRFRGFVAEYDYAFDPSQEVNQLQLSLVDMFEVLGTIEMFPGGYFGDPPPPASVGQIYYGVKDTIDAANFRVVSILEDCEIDPAFYVVFSLNVDVYPGIYSPGEAALSAIQETVDAEFPDLANAYVDRLGRFVVHGREAVFDPVGVLAGPGVSDLWDWHHWHAGDGAAVSASPASVAQIRQFGFNHGRSFIVNTASAYPINSTDAAITAQTYPAFGTASASRSRYGFRTWSAPNLLTAQGRYFGGTTTTALVETKRFSEYKVKNYETPVDRITALGFRPLRPDDERAAAVHRLLGKIDVSDQIDVTIGSPGGGGFDGAATHWFVQGIHETVTGRIRDGIAPGDEGYDDVTLTLDVSPGPSYRSMFPMCMGAEKRFINARDHGPGGADPSYHAWEEVGSGGGGGVVPGRRVLLAVFDGAGSPLTAGMQGDAAVPFDSTITEWVLLADQAGSLIVDIWKDGLASYPPTVADKVTGTAPPTLASSDHASSSTLTGWTTAIAAGDTIRFDIVSASAVRRATLALTLEAA